MANNIESNLQQAAGNAQQLAGKAQTLQQQTIAVDSQSTITARDKSKTAVENAQAQKSTYQSVLTADAGHIESLGAAFDGLDQALSGIKLSTQA